MPRGERPLDQGDGVLTQFAAGLRLLRDKAGSPTYRELGQRAHYSAGTLSEAAGGKKLPTLAVALAYVRACGGDVAEGERRWHATAALLGAVSGNSTDSAEDDVQPPYAGLAAFQPEDADRFFGRESLVSELRERLSRLRFLAVFGPSGAGKSSVLRAGLVPRLRERASGEKADRVVVLFTPGQHPMEECAVHLAALLGLPAGQVCSDLLADPRNLHRVLRQALVERDEGAEAVLIIDQFEEVFTLCTDPGERAAFIDALLTAATAEQSRCRVVVGVRADFYPHCADHPPLAAALSQAQVLVGPMTAGELRAAIVQPAVQAGCTVEGALVAQLVAEAGGRAGVLPLLSHALRETWRRRRGNTLGLTGYQATGGIAGALAKTADDQYELLDTSQQRLARQLFLRLTALGEGTEDTKRRIRSAELDADPEVDAVLRQLAQARLVTLDSDTVEITHESLIKAWPRLRGWLAEDREGLHTHRRLTEAAEAWESLGHDFGALYRGARLHSAQEWAAGNDVLLTRPEREFLRASVEEHDAEYAAIRRRTRRLRQLVALLTVFLLVAVLATVYAVDARNSVAEERNLAISQKVANQSDGLRAANPALAAQLSLAAYHLFPSPEARGSLLSAFATPYATQLTSHTDGVNVIAYRPDGQVMATASDDRTARLWEVSDPHHPRELATLDGRGEVYAVAFSPDGRMLAVAGQDRIVRLWDVTDPRAPREVGAMAGHTDRVYSVAFSPDGHLVASASEDHTARLWDVTDTRRPRPLGLMTAHTERVYRAVFAPGGTILATASGDNTARLWDVRNPTIPRPLGTLSGHTDRVYSLAFNPDGRVVATAGYDGSARLWDVADPANPRALATLTGHAGKVTSAVFNPDGRTVATAGEDRTVRLWDVADPRHPSQSAVFTGHTERIWCAVFSPDGRTLTTAAWDRTVRLWDLADPRRPGPPTALSGGAGPVFSVAVSSRGNLAATGSADGAPRLWDVGDTLRPRLLAAPLPRALATPSGHTRAVMSVAFSPDGHLLATALDDYTARLWDVTDPSHPRELAILPGHIDTATSVAFSPYGHTLAVGSADKSVLLWDVTDASSPVKIATSVEISHLGPVYSVAFSPDGRVLATASWDQTVRLWDVTDRPHSHLVATLAGHTGPVWSVVFGQDGHTVATAGDDRTARLWDVADLAHPREVSALTGHSGHVYSVAFSGDGRTVITGSDDRTARLWDVADPARPREIAALTGHANRVWSVAFGPDGHTAATGSDDGTALLRETDIDFASARICAAVHPSVTPAEWDRYLPGVPFRAPCP